VAHSSRWYTRCTPLSPACAFGAWQRVNLTATTLFAVSPGRRRGDPTGASRAGRGRAHWGVPRRRAGPRPPIGVGPRRVPVTAAVTLAALAVLLVWIGVYPAPFIALARLALS
jgi:hypothetical protein